MAPVTVPVTAPVTLPVTVWQAVRQSGRNPHSRRFSRAEIWRSFACHQAVFWGALAITLAAAAAASVLQRPDAVVETRVAVAGPGHDRAAGRHAIADAMRDLQGAGLRLAALDAVGWQQVFPDLAAVRPADRDAAARRLAGMLTVAPADDGEALRIRMRHPDAGVAADFDRALVAVLLARLAPVAPPARPAPLSASPSASREVLAGLRARAAADLASADRRAAILSDGLTDTAHDMVAALRATAGDRPPTADVLDQGRVLLAELQLKRLQLVSKYQDDFPAVTALDGEIDRLRGFLAGQQRREPGPPNPVSPVLDTLGAERRRLTAELDEENAQRVALRAQLAALDQQIAAAVPAPPAPAPAPVAPLLLAGSTLALAVPDPRLVSVPAILLVGLLGALLLQFAMLRSRTTLATVAEVEAALSLPVLRCLDRDGNPLLVERKQSRQKTALLFEKRSKNFL